MAPTKSVIVGTAGHIDHGKTALVKALTGIDADRLEEEKRRGITIDIGFAHLESPDGNGGSVHFGFVDVPGHEKFVRNMLAGVGGIDLVLLIIAADEGIKPQTREHFEICRLLGIERGITVLTKCDKVSAELLAATRRSVEQFLQGSFLADSPILPVSSTTGTGVDDLKRELVKVAQRFNARDANALLRLPIDRVFTMKGFGTVVTGTLVSGSVRVGDELIALPYEKPVRVRGIQVHGKAAETASAGQRVALNLASIAKDELTRGQTLVQPDSYGVTSIVDVAVTMVAGENLPKTGTRFHVHSYTSETIATVQRSEAATGYARLRLASPMVLMRGDRFILRRFSPVTTVGGGVLLDAAPLKTWSQDFLRVMHHGDAAEQLFARVERRGRDGLSFAMAVRETGWPLGRLRSLATQSYETGKMVRAAEWLIASHHIEAAAEAVVEGVRRFHAANPLVAGIGREELRASLRLTSPIFMAVVEHLFREKKLQETNELLQEFGRAMILKDDEAQARKTIETAFSSAGLKVPAMNEVLAGLSLDKARAHKIVTLLLRERALIKLGDDLVFHASALDALRRTMKDYKATSATIDVARFKDITQVSRKYAIPLLEFLDRERVTRRQGDVRVIL